MMKLFSKLWSDLQVDLCVRLNAGLHERDSTIRAFMIHFLLYFSPSCFSFYCLPLSFHSILSFLLLTGKGIISKGWFFTAT